MIIIESFGRGGAPRAPPLPKAGLGTAMPWRSSPLHRTAHLPGNLASGLAPLSPRRLPSHPLRPQSGQDRPLDRRRGDSPVIAIVDPTATTPASASPTQAVARPNSL